MKHVIFFTFLATYFYEFAQEPLSYKGKIGTYPIEVIFESCDSLTGTVLGKYRYQNKKNYLTLTGTIHDEVLLLNETVGNDTTGTWYLKMDDDSIVGYWTNTKKVIQSS